MKKLLFGLIATVMFAFTGNAQELSLISKKTVLNSQVVTIVEASKSIYVKGMSYDDFIKALLTPSPTIPSQDGFYRKVYYYINNNTPTCDIIKADNIEFENYLNDLSKNSTYQKAGDPFKKKWWQILINAAINITIDAVGLDPNNQINIDLWP